MTRRGHALNKECALNSEVRLITRVYGMVHVYVEVGTYFEYRYMCILPGLIQESEDCSGVS